MKAALQKHNVGYPGHPGVGLILIDVEHMLAQYKMLFTTQNLNPSRSTLLPHAFKYSVVWRGSEDGAKPLKEGLIAAPFNVHLRCLLFRIGGEEIHSMCISTQSVRALSCLSPWELKEPLHERAKGAQLPPAIKKRNCINQAYVPNIMWDLRVGSCQPGQKPIVCRCFAIAR